MCVFSLVVCICIFGLLQYVSSVYCSVYCSMFLWSTIVCSLLTCSQNQNNYILYIAPILHHILYIAPILHLVFCMAILSCVSHVYPFWGAIKAPILQIRWLHLYSCVYSLYPLELTLVQQSCLYLQHTEPTYGDGQPRTQGAAKNILGWQPTCGSQEHTWQPTCGSQEHTNYGAAYNIRAANMWQQSQVCVATNKKYLLLSSYCSLSC